jgi:RNA polymerase sigma-70 factor (ECF subfamily)
MTTTATQPARSVDPDEELLRRLRTGDERAFIALVERYQSLMLRVAQTYVRTPSVAEEVVQETWVGVLDGLDRFEGRSTLKTWLFRILTNRAKTRGEREARCTPFSCMAGGVEDEDAVDADRFLPPDHGRWPGHWAAAPSDWERLPDERLLGRETIDCIRVAVDDLPARQREVIVLRDIEGWSAEEVCDALDVSEVNQRVLLHRARSKVRAALETYLVA